MIVLVLLVAMILADLNDLLVVPWPLYVIVGAVLVLRWGAYWTGDDR